MSRPAPVPSSAAPATRLFADRPVGTKVIVAVLVAALVAVAVGALAVLNLRSLASASDAIYEEGLRPVALIGQARSAQADARRELANVLIAQSAADIADNEGDVKTQEGMLLESLA